MLDPDLPMRDVPRRASLGSRLRQAARVVRRSGRRAAGPSWMRVRRVARAVADKFPLTPLGTLLVAAAYLAQRELGRKHQDVVLYVAGLGALGVVLVATTFVVVTTLVLASETWRLPSLGHLRLDA